MWLGSTRGKTPMTAPLVLSLFPGIGLLDMAFELEGFCVVRGPDLLWGGDIRRFHSPRGVFQGVIGGPPCPSHSLLRYVVRANGSETEPDLIPEFERVVQEAASDWFLMEQVRAAPLPAVLGYTVKDRLVRDVCVGGASNRLRRFSLGVLGDGAGFCDCGHRHDGGVCGLCSCCDFRDTGFQFQVEEVALHTTTPEYSVLASGPQYPRVYKGKRKVSKGGATVEAVQKAMRVQGLPADFFDRSPFTVTAQHRVLGNGVPLPMGRAVAKAVKRAMYPDMAVA